jgi:hypothetical protein
VLKNPFGEQASREEILEAYFSSEFELDGIVSPKQDGSLALLCSNEFPLFHWGMD